MPEARLAAQPEPEACAVCTACGMHRQYDYIRAADFDSEAHVNRCPAGKGQRAFYPHDGCPICHPSDTARTNFQVAVLEGDSGITLSVHGVVGEHHKPEIIAMLARALALRDSREALGLIDLARLRVWLAAADEGRP